MEEGAVVAETGVSPAKSSSNRIGECEAVEEEEEWSNG